MANINCLEGVKCPRCGNEEEFAIWAAVKLIVTDDGSEDPGGDHEWDSDSWCVCPKCQHSGKFGEFSEDDEKEEAPLKTSWETACRTVLWMLENQPPLSDREMLEKTLAFLKLFVEAEAEVA